MSEEILTCVYCGHAYLPGTPPSRAKVLTDHIKVCKQHPMRNCVLALRAVLLFHSGSPWEETKNSEWQCIAHELLSHSSERLITHDPVGHDASTRTLCDMVRAALKDL